MSVPINRIGPDWQTNDILTAARLNLHKNGQFQPLISSATTLAAAGETIVTVDTDITTFRWLDLLFERVDGGVTLIQLPVSRLPTAAGDGSSSALYFSASNRNSPYLIDRFSSVTPSNFSLNNLAGATPFGAAGASSLGMIADARGPVLLASGGANNRRAYRISPTGAVTLLGTITSATAIPGGFDQYGMGMATVSGVHYLIISQSSRLWTYDVATNTISQGASNLTGTGFYGPQRPALGELGGTLYLLLVGFGGGSSRLFTVNPSANTVSQIGTGNLTLPVSGPSAIALVGHGGTLYCFLSSTSAWAWASINTANATFTTLASGATNEAREAALASWDPLNFGRPLYLGDGETPIPVRRGSTTQLRFKNDRSRSVELLEVFGIP